MSATARTLGQSSRRISLQRTITSTSSAESLTLPYLYFFSVLKIVLQARKKMLKIKGFFGILLVLSCLIAISQCNTDRSLIGCFTGMNRCSESLSWFSSRLLDSCNDHCIKGGTYFCILLLVFLFEIKIAYRYFSGSIGGSCVRIPSNCQLRSSEATVLQCRCY